MTVQSPPPYPPPGPPAKKGLSPLAWVGIGCGAILLIGFLVFVGGAIFVGKKAKEMADNPDAAAMTAIEWAIKANPDVELVKSDPDTKTFTVRDKKTGEVTTVSFEDAKQGKFSVKTEGADGKEETANVDFSGSGMKVTNEKGETATFEAGGSPNDIPSWVPTYPGATAQGAFSSKTDTETNVAYTVTTKDAIDDVLAFYKEKLQAQGFKVDENTTATNGKTSGGIVTATSGDEKRQVTLMVGEGSEGGTSLTVTVAEKK